MKYLVRLSVACLVGLVAAVGAADDPVALPLGADALAVVAVELVPVGACRRRRIWLYRNPVAKCDFKLRT